MAERPASTAQGFRLIRGIRQKGLHGEVRVRIRERWGDAAVQDVEERIEAGTEQEAEAWLRRSAYFPDLASTGSPSEPSLGRGGEVTAR